MRDHTKLRAFELADEVALLMNMTFLSANQRLWRPRRFWAPCFDQCAKTNSLQPFDRLRAMSIVEWPTA
ncbi:MAG TPA: hypothetical protein VMW42_11565 [Desulfatiglandales bacterium]|nr:hypothetical protein [Desulfatiglandales bacterium]